MPAHLLPEMQTENGVQGKEGFPAPLCFLAYRKHMSCVLFVPQMLIWGNCTSGHFVPKVSYFLKEGAESGRVFNLYERARLDSYIE